MVVGDATITGTPPPLPTSDAVLYADDGHVWVGTSAGATKLDGATGQTLLSVPDVRPQTALAGGGFSGVRAGETGAALEAHDAQGQTVSSTPVPDFSIRVTAGVVLEPTLTDLVTTSIKAVFAGIDPSGAFSKIGEWFRPPTVQNISSQGVLVKPDDCRQSMEWVLPGTFFSPTNFYDPIDGVRPWAWTDDWLKVSDLALKVTIDGNGEPWPSDLVISPLHRHRTDAEAYAGPVPQAELALYKSRPGRKSEPEWSTAADADVFGLPAGRKGLGMTDWNQVNPPACGAPASFYRSLFKAAWRLVW